MVKRAVWFGLGAASGGVAAIWGLTSVRRAGQRLSAERVPGEVADAIRWRGRSIGRELRAAVTEGREGMRQREAELRAGLASERTRPNRAGSPEVVG